MNRGIGTKGAEAKPKPRLVLVTPLLEDTAAFAPQLASACSAADVSAVILRLAPAGNDDLIARIRSVTDAIPADGPAVMLDGHVRLLAKTAAAGAHLSAGQIEAAAPTLLAQNRMIGAGRLQSRHDAMIAGEAGAHYVLFGEPDPEGRRPGLPALVERIEWWSELFVIPCVAYTAQLDEIEPLVAAGADFIALGEETIWSAPEGPGRALAAAMLHLVMTERAQ